MSDDSRAGVDMTGQPDPEVVRRVAYEGFWPADQPFPLTPLEAWYVLQGWEVAPAAGMTLAQAMALPGKVEAGGGWVRLWQC